jgi:hypothetical protein
VAETNSTPMVATTHGPPATTARGTQPVLVVVFAAVGFLGAMLLFLSEPLAARALLPSLGGSAAVWNTAMAFFQVLLLIGYVIAHLLVRYLPWKLRWPIQVVLLATPLLLMPFPFPEGGPAPGESPVLWELGRLAVMVGGPFLALATVGPTVQAWFARTRHQRAADPFFLYAASNLGSFVGLLAYPLAVEPALGLVDQARWFRTGYLVFLVVALGAVAAAARGTDPATAATGAPIDNRKRLFWLAAAAVPSLMLLGVSRHVATDVASFPLLWVVPLGLYLVTFVIAFSQRSGGATRVASRLFPLLAIPAAIALTGVIPNIWLGLGLPLVILVVSGLLAHGRLYASRPQAGRLTEFYIWVSLGGALGGLFGALVAPAIFDSVLEYPLALVGTAALLPAVARRLPKAESWILLAVLAVALLLASQVSALSPQIILLGVAGVAAYRLAGPSLRITPLLAGLLLVAVTSVEGSLLLQERTFYGVHRVLADGAGNHVIVSGTTIHGMQRFQPAPELTPLAYYVDEGPFGDVMATLGRRATSIGIIGLGSGALAAYALPGQTFTFYEIDQAVVDIAENPTLFTFLRDTPGLVEVVVGDGRLALDRPHDPYDLLVVDAFSSDAIPSHLLTAEALGRYWDHLTPEGALAIHISNRHMDLEPVVGALAADLGLVARVRHFVPRSEQGSPTSLVVIARRPADLLDLATDPEWVPLRIGSSLWTDDYVDLWGVIIWR